MIARFRPAASRIEIARRRADRAAWGRQVGEHHTPAALEAAELVDSHHDSFDVRRDLMEVGSTRCVRRKVGGMRLDSDEHPCLQIRPLGLNPFSLALTGGNAAVAVIWRL